MQVSSNATVATGEENTLTSLPHEIIIQILLLVDPFDILAFRKVSKQCYLASCDRVLWARRLDMISYERDIFLATFDFERMTLEDLEDTCTAPYLFRRELHQEWDHSSKFLRPEHSYSCDVESPDHKPHSFYIVGGGRYVITYWANSVKLWDMRSPVRTSTYALKAIDTISVSSEGGFKIETIDLNILDRTASTLYVQVMMSQPARDAFHFALYRIDLRLDEPRFVEVYSVLWNFFQVDSTSLWILLENVLDDLLYPEEFLLVDFEGKNMARFNFNEFQGSADVEVYLKNDKIICHEFIRNTCYIRIYPLPKTNRVERLTDYRNLPLETVSVTHTHTISFDHPEVILSMTPRSLHEHHLQDYVTLCEVLPDNVRSFYYILRNDGAILEHQGQSLLNIGFITPRTVYASAPITDQSLKFGKNSESGAIRGHSVLFNTDRVKGIGVVQPENVVTLTLTPGIEDNPSVQTVLDFAVVSSTGRVYQLVRSDQDRRVLLIFDPPRRRNKPN